MEADDGVKSHLSSGRTHVFHTFDAADAVVRDFTAGCSNVIPETARTLISKPGGLTWKEETEEMTVICVKRHGEGK